ncbi:MAG TPA: SAM-dependent chlorinase/fluorinase [Bryobacteraceae bacterium]|nr:SAM-dependent chlorinase/fluorinase [Bryobacteraceae bacterium]
MKRPVITLLTDFGSMDHYVGAMKGVMLGICPTAQFVDVSHEVAPYAIPEGAYTLAQVWQCFPKGTVHLIVVDPGVGSARRPILLEAAGHRFVAPDNGVLTMVFDAAEKHKVRHITAVRYFRKPVSRTFHGRDIFAPVAAHVASGLSTIRVGKRIEDYVRLDFGRPIRKGPKAFIGAILKIDRFGNVITNFASEQWLKRQPFEMRIGGRAVSHLASNYAEMKAGELFLIGGSAGYLEVSMNQGSAAAALGTRVGASVELFL